MSLDKGKSREQIAQEWRDKGMQPRIQSPEEMRRVLMTWTKNQLISALIRAESNEAKANLGKLQAQAESQDVRTNRLVLPRGAKQHQLGYVDPFNVWLRQQVLGTTLDARDVFKAGWVARARAAEAVDGDVERRLEQEDEG